MSEIKTLAKQTLIYGLGTIVPRFLNYAVLTFIYTRIFDKSEYGVVTELYAWMVFLLIILTYGMETGFFRFARDKQNYKKIYSTALISLFTTSTLFVLLVFLFINPVSSAMGYADHHDYIKMFALIVAIDAFTAIPFARLRNENKVLIFSLIKILNVVIIIISVFFFFFLAPEIYKSHSGGIMKLYDPDYGVGYVFLANLIGSCVTLLALLPFILDIKIVFLKKIWLNMIHYSFPLLVAGLAGSVNDALDKVLLRRMSSENGLAVVGEYGAAYKIAVLMALFIQMYRYAAEPFFFERYTKNKAKESYAYIMKYFILVMLVIFLFLNLYISGFQYFLGEQFRGSLIIVPFISMGYLLYGVYVNHSIWYKLTETDNTKYGIYITGIGALVTIFVNVIFIPRFNYMASAVAHIVSYGSMIFCSFLFAKKHYYINYNMKRMIPYFAVSIVLVIISKLVNFENLILNLGFNTFLLCLFLIYIQKKEKIFNVFFSRD